MTADDWREQAVCRDADPELFFPISSIGAAYERQVAAAKAVCARCPVRDECLDFATAALSHGIAGGLTAEERRGHGRSIDAGDVVPGRDIVAPRHAAAEECRRLLNEGLLPVEVASRAGVDVRTAQRWAAALRRERTGVAS